MTSIHIMNLRSIDLNLLTVFDAILTEGNLTRASKKLGLSQPAMSNALSRLRATLDDPLFVRVPQGMRPTSRARLIGQPIREALGSIQTALRQDTTFDYGSSTRTFVIAVEDYGETVIVPHLMNWLTRVAPGILIKIRPEPGTALREELKHGSVALAMDYSRSRDNEFQVKHLLDETLVSLVRKDHPTVGDSLSLEQYIALPHVVFAHAGDTGSRVDRTLKKLGLARKIALQVPHFLSMPLIVRNTNFVCTIPKRMAQVYARHFRLKALKTPIGLPSFPLYLMWHKSMTNDPSQQWLRNAFYNLCQRL